MDLRALYPPRLLIGKLRFIAEPVCGFVLDLEGAGHDAGR